MPTIGSTSRPAYIYDADTDTWIPVGVGAHSHTSLDSATFTYSTFTAPVFIAPEERTTVAATAATGTINFDADTQGVLYYTSNATGTWTLNVRGSGTTTMNSKLAIGDAYTLSFLVTQGASGASYYHTALTIDGNAQTVKWSGGTAPAAGNASAIDAYTFTVVKTGSAAFTVLGVGPVKYA